MQASWSESQAAINFITRVRVEKLFGSFTYDLPFVQDGTYGKPTLTILYGDNGSGKTTILKLIYNLLSSRPGKDNRSYIAATPFSRLEIELADGITLVAGRADGRLTGSFGMFVERDGSRLGEIGYSTETPTPEPPSRRLKQASLAEKEAAFLDILAGLNLTVRLLGDDRKTLSYEEPDEGVPATVLWSGKSLATQAAGYYATAYANYGTGAADKGPVPITAAVSRLEQLIRQQALEGSSLGEATSNQIYSEIAKHIAMPAAGQATNGGPGADELRSLLAEQARRSVAFSALGLTSALDVDDILASLSTQNLERLHVLQEVLKPYIDGIRARLDALEATQKLVETFIRNINSFYSHKHVEFHVTSGLSILTPDGAPLSLDLLSSGEKQLLLLLCNVVTAREHPCIFLIDEPEISLNVKWQRRLVQSLLECAEGSSVQFIMATHSIELLARHQDSVVKLDQARDAYHPNTAEPVHS